MLVFTVQRSKKLFYLFRSKSPGRLAMPNTPDVMKRFKNKLGALGAYAKVSSWGIHFRRIYFASIYEISCFFREINYKYFSFKKISQNSRNISTTLVKHEYIMVIVFNVML